MKKYILLFSIIFVVVLSGCKGSSGSKPITDVDVRKGTDGLVIEFTKNAPPDRVFEDSVFPIAMHLRNKGASDIKQGFLALGFEKTYVDFADEKEESIEFEIKGKSIFNINGDEEFITLNAKTKKVGAQSETHPSTILATACYPYKTILGTSVCVDTDIFGTKLRDKACEVKDIQFSKGQGGPITITKIETRMLPSADQDPDKVKPHFIIFIENKGNGEVIASDKIKDACSNKPLNYKDFNKIKITASLSGKELNCNIGEKKDITEIRLREKKDMVRCTLEDGVDRNQDAYTAPLQIELNYGYTFTISKDIIIEKILTY
ncbi:hypothetical protein JYT91_01335 [archaeon AH-315-M20]|nr:hypothetical protein [archaeon AH-315-M20]